MPLCAGLVDQGWIETQSLVLHHEQPHLIRTLRQRVEKAGRRGSVRGSSLRWRAVRREGEPARQVLRRHHQKTMRIVHRCAVWSTESALHLPLSRCRTTQAEAREVNGWSPTGHDLVVRTTMDPFHAHPVIVRPSSPWSCPSPSPRLCFPDPQPSVSSSHRCPTSPTSSTT